MSKNSSKFSFWASKIFSFFGIFPIGLYVFFHLYGNLRSLLGEESFNQHLREWHSLPMSFTLFVLVIWIPITYHGLYGLFSMKKSQFNGGRFPYFGNLKYILQRLSGLGLLLFIPAHLYKTKIEPSLEGVSLDFNHMVHGLKEPLTFFVYMLGILGVSYHLSNGLWQFSIGWGIVRTEKGMKRVQKLSYVLFILLLLMGYGALYGFISH